MGTKLDASTKKITLVELDLSQRQLQWINWTAYVWYINFTNVYALVDPSLLVGWQPQNIVQVGSAKANGALLISVASVALAITTAGSYYWDPQARQLYIHLTGGSEPSLQLVMVGVTLGFSNIAGIYNGIYYEGKVKTLPTVKKSKDPLFYGMISLDNGTIDIDNTDGMLDKIGENQSSLFGSQIRVLQGFDSDPYANFKRLTTRIVEDLQIDRANASMTAVDVRKGFLLSLPVNVYDAVTYPYIKPANVGKPKPLAYGVCLNVPCTCLNETQVGATWSFMCADGSYHAIQSIDAIRVNGVAVTPSGTNLAAGTFTLANGSYSSGQTVTADIHAYTNGVSLISNAADVVLDLLNLFFGLTYIAANFDLTEWAAANALLATTYPGGIGLFIDTAADAFTIIQQICASFLLNLIPHDDGTLTLRMYTPGRAVSQALGVDDLFDVPTYNYDSSQIISYTVVNYARDWAANQPQVLQDMSQDTAIFNIYGRHVLGTFDTFLTTLADAQTFSTAMLALQGAAIRTVTLTYKMQPFDREIMDFVTAYVWRPQKSMIGQVLLEVTEKDVTTSQKTVIIGRIVQNLSP